MTIWTDHCRKVGFAGIGLLLRPGSNLDLLGVALVLAAQIAWGLARFWRHGCDRPRIRA